MTQRYLCVTTTQIPQQQIWSVGLITKYHVQLGFTPEMINITMSLEEGFFDVAVVELQNRVKTVCVTFVPGGLHCDLLACMGTVVVQVRIITVMSTFLIMRSLMLNQPGCASHLNLVQQVTDCLLYTQGSSVAHVSPVRILIGLLLQLQSVWCAKPANTVQMLTLGH